MDCLCRGKAAESSPVPSPSLPSNWSSSWVEKKSFKNRFDNPRTSEVCVCLLGRGEVCVIAAASSHNETIVCPVCLEVILLNQQCTSRSANDFNHAQRQRVCTAVTSVTNCDPSARSTRGLQRGQHHTRRLGIIGFCRRTRYSQGIE